MPRSKVNKITPVAQTAEEKLFASTLNNVIKVGDKLFASIPTELIFADDRFQRTDDTSASKIKQLAEHWDINKMDPLRVSVHNETHNFSNIDGYHRQSAAKLKGINFLTCEILQGLSDDPKERLKQEAKIFAGQDDNVTKLTPQQKHKANCICGVKENIELQKLISKYDVLLKPDRGRGRVKKGHLAGFTAALAVCKVNPALLDSTFEIIRKTNWNIARNGYSASTIRAISAILAWHGNKKEIISYVVEYLKPVEPDGFYANARAKYPERSENERNAMLLEDFLVEKKGIERKYSGGSVIITNTNVDAVA